MPKGRKSKTTTTSTAASSSKKKSKNSKGGDSSNDDAPNKSKVSTSSTEMIESSSTSSTTSEGEFHRVIPQGEGDGIVCSGEGCNEKDDGESTSPTTAAAPTTADNDDDLEATDSSTDKNEEEEEDAKISASDAVVVSEESSNDDKDSATSRSDSESPTPSEEHDDDNDDDDDSTKDNLMEEEAANDDSDTTDSKDADMVDDSAAEQEGGEEVDGDEEGEAWDLVEILSEEVITQLPIPCDSCPSGLKACVVYQGAVSKEKWHGCLDCQEDEFGDWPEKSDDYKCTVKNVSASHKRTMLEHCSNNQEHEFPDFASIFGGSDSSPSKKNKQQKPSSSKEAATSLTPVPPSQVKAKKANKQQATVTPSPYASIAKKKKEEAEAAKLTKNKKKLNELHQKWQKDSNRLGGGPIIVSKPDAKKLIHDSLYDQFKPMNITEIYQDLLKGKIPQPILKSCLDDMSAINDFEMSDDEDDDDNDEGAAAAAKSKKAKAATTTKKESDDYYASLCIKAGRNANVTLYFIDYTKSKNCGDLDAAEFNEIQSKVATAESEEDSLKRKFKELGVETTSLLKQPTNVDATQYLAEKEPEMETLRAEVGDARGYKANEGDKNKLKKSIGKMAGIWRKRQRLCLDFLNTMQEVTEMASFATKKILNADGPIYIEGDDYAIKSLKAAAEAKMKKKKNSLLVNRNGPTNELDPLSNPEFVAVRLVGGAPKRVFLNDRD